MENRQRLKKALIWAAIILGGFVFLKYVVRLLLPFIIAFFIALILQPPVKIINKRTKISVRIISGVFVALVLSGLGFLVFFLCSRLLTEVGKFVTALNNNSDGYVNTFFEYLDHIAEKLPFIDALGGDFSTTIADSINNMISNITAQIPQVISSFIGMLPEILLFAVILIMASYYFCVDFDKITKRIYNLFPQKAQEMLCDLRARLADSGVKYIKACIILSMITFVELLVGFLMLGVDYSFTLALIVAAVDFLPVLGAGTVLLPWSLVMFISGDRYTALGLIIIFLVVTVVRRFAEPKIISEGIGLSPVLTLLSMYIGFKLFGLAGLFFAPVISIVIIHMLPDDTAEKFGLKKSRNSQKIRIDNSLKK